MRDELDFRSDLPDLSGASLEELSRLGGGVLAGEIEAVFGPDRRSATVCAGFSSYIGDAELG
ncbi:hypothetical protein DZF91_34905 [Actinomadura logoneensis]|uniref:FXSXX-COOH protein n=1 Tax=Actinomadura logoneensis TaxID=2293572 RepID=A0A372JAN7_9ACTN|nr:hypothetical protein [Actinomadura logoneensis]RFU37050.1 hypothetical protein DZF91_34905 [Actinomadura logoneensis]